MPRPRLRQVGELLQERREDLGLDLEEVGAALKIKPTYLVALEQSRADELPGAAYAIGFVRAYADFLGLNSDQVLARFKAESAGIAVRQDLALPVPLGERSLPGGALVLVALILGLCGYGTWYYLSTGDRDRPQRVAAIPAALQTASGAAMLVPPPTGGAPIPDSGPAPEPAPVVSPALVSGAIGAAINSPAPAAAPPNPPVAAPAAPKSEPPPSAAARPAAVSAPPAAAAPASAPPIPPAPPTTIAAASSPPPTPPQPVAAKPVAPVPPAANAGGGQVAIRATADCWIQVRAPDQTIVFSRILKSGETYKVPQRPGLSLRTGNAGALEVTVDGKPAPSIGAVGALRRDVVLDPAELSAGTAVHG